MRELTNEERKVVYLLGQAAFHAAHLPVVHAFDYSEFVTFIHGAQNIVFARPNTETIHKPVESSSTFPTGSYLPVLANEDNNLR